jgi:hypothetical protein
MDTYTYSQKTVDEFVREKLCGKDALLYRYYQEGKVQRFRNRLSRLVDDDDVKTVVQTFITDATRDVVLNLVGELTTHMKSYGDLIISGGEAINAYLAYDQRIVTTDIDTKFIPVIKIGKSLLKFDDEKMFGYIQLAKLKMWDKLGQLVMRYNTLILNRIRKLVIDGPLGKFLGMSLPKNVHVTRRYTLLSKSKNIGRLIDIELFALDLVVRYYFPSKKVIAKQNIGGLIDIAFMRPLEFGYEATYTKRMGIPGMNPLTGKKKWNWKVHVASVQFLIEDIYALQKYNLRPTKKEKDRKRLYRFAKFVLGSRVQSTDSIDTIFKKSIREAKTWDKHTVPASRPAVTDVEKVLRLNPYKYERVTTKPDESKTYSQLFYGIKGSDKLEIPGYYPTQSNYRFDINKGDWVKNTNPLYIHNEATFRPSSIKKFPRVQLEDILYGYNPVRNRWMSRELVRKSAMIPLVGLKIKTVQ